MQCTFIGCGRAVAAKGLCLPHYKQRRNGRELSPIGSRHGGFEPRPAEERFWEKVNKDNYDGCPWIWVGAITSRGHGNFALVAKRGQSKYIAAHRFMYQLTRGPVADGLDIDHICHNEAARRGTCDGGETCLHRRCVYPEHLVAKSRRENLLASPLTLPSRMVSGEIVLPYYGKTKG